MKRMDSCENRAGFTMLELIVVIGIIGILMGALTPWVLRMRQRALTVQCQNNMKNLAQGVFTYAASHHGEHAAFPSAGYYRTPSPALGPNKRPMYDPRPSWISNKGDIKKLNNSVEEKFIGNVAHFTDPEEDLRTAVTNGAIWQASGASFEIYRCPVHAKAHEKKYGRQPGWSYMMNQEFGFNRHQQGVLGWFGASHNSHIITVSTESDGERGEGETASRAFDKVLLFAEVQGIDVNDSAHGVKLQTVSGDTKTDAVLEYPSEDMGFNHDMGRHQYGGNVVFADGHAETIVIPRKGMTPSEITRCLCQGYDMPKEGESFDPGSSDNK